MELYTYKYKPIDVAITLDKTYTLENGVVTYFSIIHDYDNRRMPVVRMTFEVDIEMVEKLFKYKDTGRIQLTLREEKYKEDETIVGVRNYLQGMWSYIPAKDHSEYLSKTTTATNEIKDDMKDIQLFDCYLISYTALQWFTKQTSMNFRNASKPAILAALFEMRNIPNGTVVATPPEDDTSVHNAIFPYGDLIGNIVHLNSRYGIYSSTPLIYYDLQYLYCINRLKPDIKMPSYRQDYNEVILTLYDPTRPDRQAEGSTDNAEDKTHYINIREDPVITDYSQKQDVNKFDTVTTVDKNGNVGKTNVNEGAKTSTNSTAMTYSYAYNYLNSDQLINDNLARGRNVSIKVNNISAVVLRPYKRYTFFPDTQFTNLGLQNSEFRLANWTLSITREGRGMGNSYLHDVTLNLFEQLR